MKNPLKHGVILSLEAILVLTMYSETDQQIVHNIALEGMEVFQKQQKLILEAINSNKESTNELIRKIAANDKV